MFLFTDRRLKKKMNVHIKSQIITSEGKPAFAVIPWDKYLLLLNSSEQKVDKNLLFQNDIVKANARGVSGDSFL